MWLFLTSMSPEGELINNVFDHFQLEKHLDTVNYYVAAGYIIKTAFIVDEDESWTDLPIEAFDGRPIGYHMRNLETEYQLALSL